MSDLDCLDNLNEAQLEAVLHIDTPLVVVSGPGSGKTRVMTNKFVYLVKEHKINPQEILAITFTNKAANVMKERISGYLNINIKSLPWVTTFHSMGAKILRQDIDKVGRDKNYSIYDQNESEKVVKDILKDMKLNEYYDVDDVKRAISDVKNKLSMTVLDTHWINIIPHIHSIYKKYKERLEESNALDFDDLLLYTFKLLKEDKEVLRRWFYTWKYFLVDEYQDTNIAQHSILRLLIGNRNCVTVVGDPLQCWGKDNIVSTAYGDTLVSNLQIGDLVESVIYNDVGYSEITNIIVNKPSDMYKVTTHSGNIIKLTKDHLMFVYNIEMDWFSGCEDMVSVVMNGSGHHRVSYLFGGGIKHSYFLSYNDAFIYANDLKKSLGFKKIRECLEFNRCEFDVIQLSDLTTKSIIPVIKNRKMILEMVYSIEHIGKEVSYNIEIANAGNMVANDILTHNCLYTWRAAHPENILKFEESYPTAHMIKLETNYRSTPTIINAANAITKHVQGDWKKKLLTIIPTKEKPKHEEIFCYEFSNRYNEAEFVAKKCLDLVKFDGYQYGDIAILMRMSFLSRYLEEMFLRYKIPYQVVGGFKFMDRAEIRDMMSYLKFAHSSVDEVAFRRCVNTPSRGIGEKAFYKIKSNYKENWYQALQDTKFPKKKAEVVNEFLLLINEIKSKILNDPTESLKCVFEKSGYKSYLAKRHDNADDREENINELIKMMRFHQNNGSDFITILEYFSLMQEQDNLDEKSNKVKVMTIHGSKGTEYKNIFLVGTEDGILPSRKAHGNSMQMEEERRLFYVAITRAIERLIISYCLEPKYITKGGKTEVEETYPSPYLKDIKNHAKFFRKY